jgi:hypothetical protein
MVENNNIDVLADGTVVRLELRTEPRSVTIGRDEPDQNFTIEKVNVVEQDHMEEALADLADRLRGFYIYSIDVNCVDGNMTTLII